MESARTSTQLLRRRAAPTDRNLKDLSWHVSSGPSIRNNGRWREMAGIFEGRALGSVGVSHGWPCGRNEEAHEIQAVVSIGPTGVTVRAPSQPSTSCRDWAQSARLVCASGTPSC